MLYLCLCLFIGLTKMSGQACKESAGTRFLLTFFFGGGTNKKHHKPCHGFLTVVFVCILLLGGVQQPAL